MVAKERAPKARQREPEAPASAEAAEGARLRQAAFRHGLLARRRAEPAAPLRPSKAVLRCDGRDVARKGAHRRSSKYLFAFPGRIAPAAAGGGRLGELTCLDSQTPMLYMDFPQGRLKLLGTIVHPRNKYLTLQFPKGAGNIACDDIFESLVVFSEAHWVGRKEDNPDERPLDLPLELQDGPPLSTCVFSGGAGRAKEATSRRPASPEASQPSDLKGAADGAAGEPASLHAEKGDADDAGAGTGAAVAPRQSLRTRGKSFKFTELDENDEEDEVEGEESAEEQEADNGDSD
eukprot:SM000064S19716  [mRNA]  locus=s64:2783:4881:- [translate_table: standard]